MFLLGTFEVSFLDYWVFDTLIFMLIRVMINLLDLEKEKTHNIWADVEDGDGKLHLLVTISGTRLAISN